jgi:phospholipid/cholesterol/gamma-HCH transport system permease protein
VKNIFGYVGRISITFLQDLSSMYALLRETLVQTLLVMKDGKRRRQARLLFSIDSIGSRSLALVLAVSALVGIIVTVLVAYNLAELGLLSSVPGIVVIAIFRFTAPLITGIIVSGRMGAAFTARIGTMKVSEEILALEVMAIDPVRYLVVQRFVGMIVALPVLTVFACFTALISSFVYSVGRLGMGPNVYLMGVLDVLTPTDIVSGVVKAFVYAVLIVVIGCYRGLVVEGSAEEVGTATMTTVVWSTVAIIAMDTVLTTAFYG